MIKIKLLDGKDYTFEPLSLEDAIKLQDLLEDVNMVPVINLMDDKKTEGLFKLLDVMFSYHHKELSQKDYIKLLDLSHVRKIIECALDVTQIK